MRTCRGIRRPSTILILATAAIALIATSAWATDITGKDPAGDVKRAKGLTKKERQALDIVSVHVVGEEGLGIFVTVTFKGKVQQAIGRGHLEDALLALILRPKEGTGTPSGLATTGAGLFGKTERVTTSKSVGVVRGGRTVRFVILGPGFANVETVEVKTFARAPTSPARLPAGVPPWFFERVFGVDSTTFHVPLYEDDTSRLSCDSLRELKAVLEQTLADVKAAPRRRGDLEARALTQDVLERAIELVNTRLKSDCQPPPTPSAADLQGQGACSRFDPTEIACTVTFVPNTMRQGVRRTNGAGAISIDAIRVVVPGSRVITAYLCPFQLSSGSTSQTTSPSDTLTCSGGTVQTGQQLTFNIRTSPNPSAGMGVQLYGRPVGGEFEGPFPIPGP